MKDLMENKWWDMVGAGFYFEEDAGKDPRLTLKLIDTAREKLKIRKYEQGAFGTERVLMDMKDRRGFHVRNTARRERITRTGIFRGEAIASPFFFEEDASWTPIGR